MHVYIYMCVFINTFVYLYSYIVIYYIDVGLVQCKLTHFEGISGSAGLYGDTVTLRKLVKSWNKEKVNGIKNQSVQLGNFLNN